MQILREPLLHFVAAGALMFAGYAAWTRGSAPVGAEAPVVIGPGEIRWLGETFAGQWRRAPTDDEMQELVSTLVDEELLAREARALGLDQDDTVVRRRLAQKMTFLVDDTAHLAEPGEEELRLFHERHSDRYRTAPRLSFRQVYFSPARRPAAAADARAVLAGLTGAEDAPAGDPVPLEETYRDLDPQAVSGLFGPDFAESVATAPVGRWTGPLPSGYGPHLVFVTARSPGAVRPFDDARVAVTEDWRRARSAQTRAAFLARLREKYGVTVDRAALSRAGPVAAAKAGP